jgi:hypothetical protein
MRRRSAGWLRIERPIGADGSGRRLEQRVCNFAFEHRRAGQDTTW